MIVPFDRHPAHLERERAAAQAELAKRHKELADYDRAVDMLRPYLENGGTLADAMPRVLADEGEAAVSFIQQAMPEYFPGEEGAK